MRNSVLSPLAHCLRLNFAQICDRSGSAKRVNQEAVVVISFHTRHCKHAYSDSASILSAFLCKVAYMKRPGQRIKDERQAKGWSQQYLADEISRIKKEKITRAAVAQWENGDSKTQKPENLFGACFCWT